MRRKGTQHVVSESCTHTVAEFFKIVGPLGKTV